MTTPKNKPAKVKILPELKELEELVGNFIQYWGFKKIHGRIWAHLYTSAVPLDTQSIMARIKVSKGLMSIALRDLLEYEVVVPASTGKYGVTYYKANDDLMFVITNVLRAREAIMLSAVGSCVDRLANKSEDELTGSQLDFAKIQSIKAMTESAQSLLTMFVLHSCQQASAENLKIFSDFKINPEL